MADKQVPLSIVLKVVDGATAGIKAFKDRVNAITAPVKQLGASFSGLSKEAGLPALVDGFKGVGGAVKDLLGKVALVGGAAALAVHGVLGLVDEFDNLGDTAERLGVSADFLSQMRFAAERSGASVEALDEGLQTFTANLGAARAGTGKMVKFLQTVSPTLLIQLKATKSNEEAVLLMANAFAKVTDPAKRAALAARTGFGPALAPLLAKGSKGVKELTDRFKELAGSQEEAAAAAGASDDALKDLHASTQGVKAAIVTGLAPALTTVIQKLTSWFVAHREDVKQWAKNIGDKLPGAVDKVVTSIKDAVKWVSGFVDDIGGWKVAAIGAAAVIAGPLVGAVVSLGAAMAATPVGAFLAAVSGVLLLAKTLHDTGGPRSSSSFDAEKAALDAGLIGGDKSTPSTAQAALMRSGALPKSAQFRIQEGRANAIAREASANIASTRADNAKSSSHIVVDFLNAPKGMRVNEVENRGVSVVDLNVGFQMGGL